MPKLYAFIDDFVRNLICQRLPFLLPSMKAFIMHLLVRLFTSAGGIVICQKLLFASSDTHLEGVIAHEIGHIKHNHTNKNVGIKSGKLYSSMVCDVWYLNLH